MTQLYGARWDVELSEAEILLLHEGVDPLFIRPESLLRRDTLLRPGDDRDLESLIRLDVQQLVNKIRYGH